MPNKANIGEYDPPIRKLSEDEVVDALRRNAWLREKLRREKPDEFEKYAELTEK